MRKRKTREQLRNERIAANRAQMPEDVFTELERRAIREKLSQLTPDREKHEHTR